MASTMTALPCCKHAGLASQVLRLITSSRAMSRQPPIWVMALLKRAGKRARRERAGKRARRKTKEQCSSPPSYTVEANGSEEDRRAHSRVTAVLAGHGVLVSQLTKAFVTRDSGFRFQVLRFTEIFSACIHCRPAVHPPPSVRRQRLQKPNHEAENSPRANQRELVLLENGVQHALKLRR